MWRNQWKIVQGMASEKSIQMDIEHNKNSVKLYPGLDISEIPTRRGSHNPELLGRARRAEMRCYAEVALVLGLWVCVEYHSMGFAKWFDAWDKAW